MKRAKHPTSNIEHPTTNDSATEAWKFHVRAGRKRRNEMKRAKHPTTNIEQPTTNDSATEAWKFHDGSIGNRKYDLEERLLVFASAVIDLSESLPNTRAGNHVAGQILRSGTSPYPNHGEAEDAESRDDFIHKLKVCLKELRETHRWARLIKRKDWAKEDPKLVFVLSEADELIRIFFSSIQTAKRNALVERRRPSVSARYLPSEVD